VKRLNLKTKFLLFTLIGVMFVSALAICLFNLVNENKSEQNICVDSGYGPYEGEDVYAISNYTGLKSNYSNYDYFAISTYEGFMAFSRSVAEAQCYFDGKVESKEKRSRGTREI